jgi:hypothetical protein
MYKLFSKLIALSTISLSLLAGAQTAAAAPYGTPIAFKQS